jgi:phenylacetate-CoA ligase
MIDGADFTPLSQLSDYRQSLWEKQSEYVRDRSALYGRVWQGIDIPRHLARITQLPLVSKEDLRQSQRVTPPFGDYLAAEPTTIRRIHRTGGTTGEAMNLSLSELDAHVTAVVGARAQGASGLGPDDVVVHCLNYQMWMGGFTDHTTLEETGATVIPFGVGNPQLLIRTIQELNVTAISCTPSYPAVLEQVLASMGVAPKDLGLRLGLFGGEAALDVPGFRERLEAMWGFAARNSNYGVTDVMCNLAGQCEEQHDLHFMALDVVHPEIIDPVTEAVLPWEPGTSGELVLTHVQRDCQPLVRFRTGDIIALTSTEPCSCGRTAPRFKVTGRADDMVVIRGVNVFPTSVAAVLHSDPDLSGEYRIVLTGPGPYDRLPLEVELASGADVSPELVKERVLEQVRQDLRVTAEVTVQPHGALPRTDGKTKRVIRT